MEDFAKGLMSLVLLPVELPLLKNEVVMYTCPAQTARTRNILSTFIQVYELAVSYVTKTNQMQSCQIIYSKRDSERDAKYLHS